MLVQGDPVALFQKLLSYRAEGAAPEQEEDLAGPSLLALGI